MHCPECGTKASPGAEICSACGNALPMLAPQANGPSAAARTMMGVAVSSLPARPPRENESVDQDAQTLVKTGASATPPSAANRTLLGMPVGAASPSPAPRPPPENQRTMLGVAPQNAAPSPAPAAPNAADGTLLGVARPGIAPIHASNGEAKGAAREAPRELGATYFDDEAPSLRRDHGREKSPPGRDKLARKRIVLPPVRPNKDAARASERSNERRALPVIVTAGALVVFAVLFAIFWRSPPPLSARVRALPDGRDAVEIDCQSCPQGTKVQVGSASAVSTGPSALIPLAAPLALGENRLKVSLDRPGGGRDESVGVTVHVSYRLRPDLSGLADDKPTVSLAIEAVSGATIEVEGKPVSVKDGPSAYPIDVSADCTGAEGEPATLRRRLPYVVKTPDGVREEGVVEIAVGIVPLRIDAPGPRVIVDGETFVLAGRTMKGAEVLAAGRPIQVGADGSFAQRMSVSSVGSTNIEIRAKVAGMAPRIVPIAVRRVEKLESAAREIMAGKPLGYAAAAAASAGDIGKEVVVSGEIVDARAQNHQTILLLDVPAKGGCPKGKEPCRVRLVHGYPNASKAGDTITAFGQLAAPFVSGNETLPEIQVAFTLPGER